MEGSEYCCSMSAPCRRGIETAPSNFHGLAIGINEAEKEMKESALPLSSSGWEGIKSLCVIGTCYSVCVVNEIKRGNETNQSVVLEAWMRVYLPEGSKYKGEELDKLATQAVPYEERVCRMGYKFTHDQTTAATSIKVDDRLVCPFVEERVYHTGCCFVSSNSGGLTLMYCLGGCILHPGGGFPIKNVNVLCLEEKSWTSGPDMISARVRFVALAVDGKIYAFGGVHRPGDVWAEFIDTRAALPRWEPMASPAKLIHPVGLTAVVVDDGEIIFFGTEGKVEDEGGDINVSGGKTILVMGPSLSRGDKFKSVSFLYHIKEDRWRSIPPEFGIPPCCSGTTVIAVGHTLFWVADSFYAYDLRGRVAYDGHVRGLHDIFHDDVSYKLKNLLHLGGNDFCLTWFETAPSFRKLHSSVIRVRLHEGFSRLDAFVVSSQFYDVPPGFKFDFSLLSDNCRYEKENLEDVGERKGSSGCLTV